MIKQTLLSYRDGAGHLEKFATEQEQKIRKPFLMRILCRDREDNFSCFKCN